MKEYFKKNPSNVHLLEVILNLILSIKDSQTCRKLFISDAMPMTGSNEVASRIIFTGKESLAAKALVSSISCLNEAAKILKTQKILMEGAKNSP